MNAKDWPKTALGALRAEGGTARSLLRAVALVAALCLFMVLPVDQASAEVRKADVIAGMTVEQRGVTVAECPSVDAEYAVLMSDDGTVYFDRNGEGQTQIASITKVMTAIVTLENAEPNTVVTVSEDASLIGESSANLMEGDQLDLDAALKALLVPSGNDAALALAETVGAQIVEKEPSLGPGAVAAFVAKMNEKAAELGCEDTVYENPHGLDDGEYAGNLHSTARDQALVARYAMTFDGIRSIVGSGSTSISVLRDGERETVDLETTDELLDMYDYAIGVKTGVTDLAGPSFMGAANKDGRELYAVVIGSTDEYQRFADTKSLFMWAYDHVHDVSLASTDVYLPESDIPVVAEVALPDWPDRTVKATLAEPEATVSVFDLEGNVSQSFAFEELHGTVREGDKVGSVVYKQRNVVVAEQDLVACETVEGPNPIETIAIWWQRLLGSFGDSPAQSQSLVYNVMPTITNYVSNAA